VIVRIWGRRHDRVLLLDAQSLLWALDPIEATPEGGVVITVADTSCRQRLEAQLELLDSLRRPQILTITPDSAEPLAEACGAGRFEWIAARQPWPRQSPAVIQTWWQALETLLTADGECRLLFSGPRLGPAGSLLRLLTDQERNGVAPEQLECLRQIAAAEGQALATEGAELNHWRDGAQAAGWQLQEQCWLESLGLELSPALLERWLAPQSAYRRRLGSSLDADTISRLGELLDRQRGSRLPQELEHTLLIAHRPG